MLNSIERYEEFGSLNQGSDEDKRLLVFLGFGSSLGLIYDGMMGVPNCVLKFTIL